MLLSVKLQEQNFYTGTSGKVLKTGLMRVMVSEPLIRAESGDYTIEIYKSNGTRKTEKELESDGMNLAIDWVGGFLNALTKKYSFLAGNRLISSLLVKPVTVPNSKEVTHSISLTQGYRNLTQMSTIVS